MYYQRPSRLHYRIAQAASWVVSAFVFRRKILRNEIKGKKGPFVVIANHETALDFVNLIGMTARPMSFVISNSFFQSLPIRGFLQKMGVIPKQQFQTAVSDLKKIKAVIDHGEPVVIYPAGLMCEDGVSTPIPSATYKFLKWLKADVYVAKTSGTYFVKPKWAKKMRPGRTYMDVYKLFTEEELACADLAQVQARTDAALLFDAYREQEKLQIRYRGGSNVEGLQHVLYLCPHCGAEFSICAEKGNTLRCKACGFAHESDHMGFLHPVSDVGEPVRYVSDWSRMIYTRTLENLRSGKETSLSAPVTVRMIDHAKRKFADVGQGTLGLSADGFLLEGVLQGKSVSLSVPIGDVPTLPFSPGKHLEVQQGGNIYRCAPKDGGLVMKFIHLLKAYYALNHPET